MTKVPIISVYEELPPHLAALVADFVSTSEAGSYLQMPDWPDVSRPPAHHSYVHLIAYDAEGRLIGYGQTRLTRLLAGYKLATIRRGPVTLDPAHLTAVTTGFAAELRKMGCCTLALNPRWQGEAAVADACARLRTMGATMLATHSQPLHQATLLVDLSGDEAALSARVKQRARRQIRTAEKKGLTLRHVETLEEARRFGPMIETFYKRRGLGTEGIPPVDELFAMTREKGVFVIGEHADKIACGHVVIADGNRAFWLVMASDDAVKDIPRNYPLVFEAMRTAQAQGFRWYDMAGTPLVSEHEPAEPTQGAANRDNFKMAFTPQYQPLVPMHVLPLRQPAHQLFFRLRQWLRLRRARRQARQAWLS